MKSFEKILRIVIATGLGIIFNKIFSSTNKIVGNLEEFKHEIPFIYTVGLLEITIFILGTSVLALIAYITYHKSRSSQKEISKIYNFILEAEVLIGSFIIGTQILNNKNKFNLCLSDFWIVSFIVVLIILLNNFIYEKNDKPKKIISKKNKLYESKKPLLKLMDEYLESMSSFSIIGKWGTGKTNLIENFFYGEEKDSNGKKYKDKYEMIYIDVSIYSSNQKIIEVIESELNNLFKNFGILKKTTTFMDELFAQNNNFLIGVYQYVFSSGTVCEERKKIEKKVCEIWNNNQKTIVFCLDNLERSNSKDRIIKLFAIINEILPSNIKKIYSYEEKEMITIFQNNILKKETFEKESRFDFIEYIEKYTFNKIEINDVSIEEILKESPIAKEYIETIIKRCDNISLISKIEKEIKKTINENIYSDVNEYMDNLNADFTKKLKNIKLKLKNPRYVENLLNYLKSSINEGDQYKYKLEYKIIRDFLPAITIDNFKIQTLKSLEIFNEVRALRLKRDGRATLSADRIEPNKLEQLCLYLLFKIDDDGDLTSDINKKINYFEMFFKNKGALNKTEEYEDLKKLKENPEINLLKILKKISFIYDEKYIEESKKYLKTQKNLNFIIYNHSQMHDLIFLQELDEIWDELSLYLFRSDKLIYHEFKLATDSYILTNKYIKDLVQLIGNDLNGYLGIQFSHIQDFLTKISIAQNININDFIRKLESELANRKDILKKLKIYEKIGKVLKVAKEIQDIKKIATGNENELLKVNSKIFKLTRNDILCMLSENGEIFEIDAKYYSQKIKISKGQVDEYIELLKQDLENPKLADGVRVLIIELINFKNKSINENVSNSELN